MLLLTFLLTFILTFILTQATQIRGRDLHGVEQNSSLFRVEASVQ